MYICITRIRKNYSNALSTKRYQQTNRWVCRVRRNWSGPTAELRRLSGSEFQTVGPAEAKERQPKGAAADTWNSQLMAAGGSQVPRPATSDNGTQ